MLLQLHCLLTFAPFCTTAFMPMRHLSSMVHDCSTAPCPTDTKLPMLVGPLSGVREPTCTPSCRFVECPIFTGWLSPAAGCWGHDYATRPVAGHVNTYRELDSCTRASCCLQSARRLLPELKERSRWWRPPLGKQAQRGWWYSTAALRTRTPEVSCSPRPARLACSSISLPHILLHMS